MSHLPLVSGRLPVGLFPIADASGLSPLYVLRKTLAAGAGGSADDVTIYAAAVPFACRLVGVSLFVSTAVALATVQLRDATGSGGNALFGALVASAAGMVQLLSSEQATATLAANASLVVRRSDSGVAGEIVIYVAKS